MTEQLNVQQMAERLCAADNILILCHKNPDGDTIGCGSALCHALKALGKTAAVLCSDAVPSRYSFTAPVPFRGEFEPKTVVAVDVASVQLFGENNGMPQYTRHIDLCIDHHAGNSGYADFTLLDGKADALGLGWVYMAPKEGRPGIIQKTGGGGGFITYMAMIPQKNFGAFVVVTRSPLTRFKNMSDGINDLVTELSGNKQLVIPAS